MEPDVAREASSLVLLNDDFSSIVNAIRQGRQIYDNLQKAVAYVVAVHVPIAGAAFVPLLFGLPPMLTPIHILFLEMIIDPACAIVFETEASEANVMQRPPRNASQTIFDYRSLWLPVMQGGAFRSRFRAVCRATDVRVSTNICHHRLHLEH